MSDCRDVHPRNLVDGTVARRSVIAITRTIVDTGVPYPTVMSAEGSAGSCERRSDSTEGATARVRIESTPSTPKLPHVRKRKRTNDALGGALQSWNLALISISLV